MSPSDRRTFLQSAAGIAAGMAITPDPQVLGAVYRPPTAVTVAVIGCGPQGREILTELAKFEDVNVAGVCDLDSRRLRRAVRRTKAAKGYADWKEMMAKDPSMATS